MFPLIHDPEIQSNKRLKHKAWLSSYTMTFSQYMFLIGLAISFCLYNLVNSEKIFPNHLVVALPFWIGSVLAISAPFLTYLFIRDYIKEVMNDPTIQTNEKNMPGLLTTVLPNLCASFICSIIYLLFFLSSIFIFVDAIYSFKSFRIFATFFGLIGFFIIFTIGTILGFDRSEQYQVIGLIGIILIIKESFEDNKLQLIPFQKLDCLLYSFLWLFMTISATRSFISKRHILRTDETILFVLELVFYFSLCTVWFGVFFLVCSKDFLLEIYNTVSLHLLISMILIGTIRFCQITYEYHYSPVDFRFRLDFCGKSNQLIELHTICKPESTLARPGYINNPFVWIKMALSKFVHIFDSIIRIIYTRNSFREFNPTTYTNEDNSTTNPLLRF